MKKHLILFLVTLFILALPMNCFASEPGNTTYTISEEMVLLGTGYTDDGVYYEVYGEPHTVNINARVSVDVERTVVYVGEVMPPATMNWSEKMSNIYMSGTLYLRSYIYNASTNRTTTIYEGTLTG